jgi:hypothetical protein
MNDKEFRQHLENAFVAGVGQGFGGTPEFDDWYDEVYGGPDCE